MAYTITDKRGRSFHIGDYIDKGSFSKVYKLECSFTKQIFAGKFINKAKLEKYGISNKVYDEIKIHHGLKHPNIVQFMTYIEHERHIVIVLEYCSKYSMVNILHSLKTLTANEAKYFMIQIVAAVKYLHRKHVVHRDLKLGNLFVNKQLEIKLGDFGLAVVVEYEGQRRFSRCGTPNYLAPEVINGIGHSYEVDIWALGCILYTMLEGTPPFQGQNTANTYNNILRGKFSISSDINNDAKDFIVRSLQTDAKCRPTVFELANMNFLVSKEPVPKPPNININESNLVPLENHNVRPGLSQVSTLLAVNKPDIWKNPDNLFVKLKNCLENVCNWSESGVGEFLSENVLLKPVVWVNSWMDYTSDYGFSYQLNNNNVGMIFNDDTRMLFQIEKQCVNYISDNGTVCFNTNHVPLTLTKKFKILVNCGEYMRESLVKAHYVENIDPNMTTEVFQWVRGENELAMFLTNGSVQVNFFSDHTKFILCGFTKTVTVIESGNCMKTLKIEGLQTFGCTNNLKGKLYVILSFINHLLEG